jgi:hypothetical protein
LLNLKLSLLTHLGYQTKFMICDRFIFNFNKKFILSVFTYEMSSFLTFLSTRSYTWVWGHTIKELAPGITKPLHATDQRAYRWSFENVWEGDLANLRERLDPLRRRFCLHTNRGCHDYMVVGFTSTCAISDYHH